MKSLSQITGTRLFSFTLFFISIHLCPAQTWIPDEDGIMPQNWVQTRILDIHFLENGPMGKDWIYGKWLDSDSILRYAAYREGGKWIPLPVTGKMSGGGATTMIQYGDTLYMGGMFTGVVIKGDTVPFPWTHIIKFHNDSIWYSSDRIEFIGDFAVSGDSLLVAASTTFYAPTDTFGPHLLTTNGVTWVVPYKVHLPLPKRGLGGPWNRVEMHKGSVYTINLPDEGEYTGVVQWDGQQWHTFGPGIYGMVSQVYDFTFYKNELYIGGSFTKNEDPRNPGEHIAKWTGNHWETVGGGSPSPVWSFFEHDGLLYCHVRDGQFGDANIPYLAAWDGHQWCGTPTPFSYDPTNFGFVNDTLWVVFPYPPTLNGNQLGLINYFDDDYVNGPDAICSTLGIGMAEAATVASQLKIFPNPASSFLEISLAEGNIEHVKIYNLSGKCIFQEVYRGSSAVEVDISALTNGIYIIEVNQQFNQKVVKM